ncbi:MAG: FAD-dependent oxidoreductase [Christensenellaceae bacterium]|nr:FAD-dependent oxidoreductase [Christensenellaceae bacterium]
MKKILSIILTLCMLMSGIILANAEMAFTPGTYDATVKGFGGDLKLEVTVDETSIKEVKIIEHAESPGISDPAITKLPALIVEKQTVALDTISGCTVSSTAILAAAKDALLKAGATEESITQPPAEDAPVSTETLNYNADVIVIGAGGAGMTAALEVLKAGGSVVIFDKTGSVGGNTIAAGSALNASDEARQQKRTMDQSEMDKIKEILALEPKNDIMAGWQKTVADDIAAYEAAGSTYLYDSPALHALQTYVGGDYVGDPAVIDAFAKGAVGSVAYLEDLGTVWRDSVDAAIGATWNRSHTPDTNFWGPKGASFVLPQAKKIKDDYGVEPVFEHKVEHIVMTDGKATGVTGTTLAGQPFEATANKSVIIATGGFGANVEMRVKYNKHWANLGEEVLTTNVKSATGDGIVMAEEIGANLVGMEWIQMLLYPLNGGSMSASINNLIFVNAEGERFVREDGRRDVISGAVLEQTGAVVWHLFDEHEVERMSGRSTSGKTVVEMVENGNLIKGESVEDLAEKLNMPLETLKKTIDDYNAAVESGEDSFGRQVFGEKLDKPPFYAYTGAAMVHHTMGGIQITPQTQVLDTNGNIIPGLFAAGEVTGGVHGGNRLGGNAIADIITFGQIAGQEAMK